MWNLSNSKARIAMASAAVVAALAGSTAEAQIQTAGDLLVNLRADDPTAGTSAWTNTGTIGGAFTEVGDAALINVGGANFVHFDPNEAYSGPTAPAGITGGGDRSIEVWVINPEIAVEDTMVAWGHRGGPDATNMAFNYGSNESFNAVGHWGGAADMGWNGAPTADTLHHLVYAYDGATARVYADGVEKSSKTLNLNTHALATDTINLMAQNNAAGGLEFVSSDGMQIAVVRIHDGALTPTQITQNFEAGVGAVPEPTALGLIGVGALALLGRRRR